jgi:hypothetical protein
MKLKYLTAAILAVAVIVPASAQSSHAVRGYTRKDGTYVAPHRATNPDSSRMNNWSTKGNVNPYTGKEGTVDPYKAPRTSTYPRPSSTRSSSGGF